MANRPKPELAVTAALAESLVRDQFPELAELEVVELSRGWDNTNLRLGADYIVRIPHRKAAAPLIEHEQRWLPELAAVIDLPISAPLFCGQPTAAYPWRWSITPWFEGVEAAATDLSDPAVTAALLGTFFRQLHVTAPNDAPPNPYRGCPLEDRRAAFTDRLENMDETYDKAAIRKVFDAAAALPPTTERVWLHGDLHARNMVVNNGELCAVIDWGDICSGDRATDLAGSFMLLPDHLSIVQQAAGASEQAWQRARGWAMNFAVVYLATSDDDPVMGAIGRRLLATLLES